MTLVGNQEPLQASLDLIFVEILWQDHKTPHKATGWIPTHNHQVMVNYLHKLQTGKWYGNYQEELDILSEND